MTTAIMASTQATYQFNLTVNINADKVLFLLLALVAFVLWKIKKVGFELGLLWSDITEAIDFTAKVFTIGFKSLAFGFVGVRL